MTSSKITARMARVPGPGQWFTAMALFGRESEADQLRADRVRQWAQRQSPYALFSCLFGVLAVLDAFTVVITVIAGPLAIGLGLCARRDGRIDHRKSAGWLPWLGMVLGGVGLVFTAALWYLLYSGK